MVQKISPDSNFIILADTAGKMAISLYKEESPVIDRSGLIRLEVNARCLAVVRKKVAPNLSTRRLQRMRSMDELEMTARQHYEQIVVVSQDDRGRVFISRKSYPSVAEAESWLAGKYGQWWIAQLQGMRFLPSPKYTDPFSTHIPMAGSLIAGYGKDLSGAFIRPGLFMDKWVMMYNGCGYYVVKVYARCGLIDNGMSATVKDPGISREAVMGDYHVFEKYQDGQTRLVMITPTLKEARKAVIGEPGLWLLAKWVDYVDMY